MASNAPVVAAPPARRGFVRLVRGCRYLSVTLLALALVFLVSQGQPTAYTLQTEPVAVACFLLVLLGLAAAWGYPLGGGLLALAAGLGLIASTHARLAGVASVFVIAALLDVGVGWCSRRGPARA